MPINMNDIRNGKVSNGNVYNSVATEEMECDPQLCNGDKLCKFFFFFPKIILKLDTLKWCYIEMIKSLYQCKIEIAENYLHTPALSCHALMHSIKQ